MRVAQPIKTRPDKNMLILADRFCLVRELLGMSCKAIAKKLDISPSAWQNYEQGGVMPGGKVFKGLVLLGFNANWLLIGEGEMMRNPVNANPAETTESSESRKQPGISSTWQAG